jgi:hypothetical protein
MGCVQEEIEREEKDGENMRRLKVAMHGAQPRRGVRVHAQIMISSSVCFLEHTTINSLLVAHLVLACYFPESSRSMQLGPSSLVVTGVKLGEGPTPYSNKPLWKFFTQTVVGYMPRKWRGIPSAGSDASS